MSDQDLFVLMIFVVVLLLAQSFIAPVMGSSAQSRRRLRTRIRGLSADVAVSHLSLARRRYLEDLTPLERRLESIEALTPIRSQLDQAGLEWPAYRVVLSGVVLAMAGGFGGALFFGGIAPLAGALVGLVLPFVALTNLRRRRMAKFEEQFPDAIGLLARSLRAGLPFTQSMQIAADELPAPVGPEFGMVFTEVNYGGDLRAALLRLLERMPTVAVMAMVTSILIQRDTGGNLAEVLERLERLMRERFRFQRKLKTLTASGKMAAWVVSLMPFLLGLFMELGNPGWLGSLVETPGGRQLTLIAFGMLVLGILTIRRMTRLDV